MIQRTWRGRTALILSLAGLSIGCEPAVPASHPPVTPEPPPAAPPAPAAPAATFTPAHRPKLVLVIVLDQFRADFLTRFDPYFGDTGFRRLLREGASMNGHYGHYATYTGPGHAQLLSGSYPYVNGISTNKFYNGATGRSEAMVFDARSKVLGVKETDPDMDVSPRSFYGSTVGDELILASGGKSKVVSLATKGRGAILLGGRLGKTYWMNDDTGEMTTSTYYAPQLPPWVTAWNDKKLADKWFGKTWDRALPNEAYARCAPDDTPSEAGAKGLGKTFPHPITGKLEAPGPAYYEAFCMTPFANDWEIDFAKAAIDAEQLGQRGVTDLLAVSLSATDLAGHDFGPMSQEVEDIVVRADKQIGDLITFAEQKVGKDEVLVVLSADHGGVPQPEHLSALGFNAGRIKKQQIKDAMEGALKAKFGGDKWVVAAEDPHIFLDRKRIAEKKLDAEQVERIAGAAAATLEGVGGYFTRSQLLRGEVPDTDLGRAILRTYFGPRGGDVVLWMLPFHFWGKHGEHNTGTTHGTFYRYDADVPLLIAGPGVKHAHHGTREMVDLAPTLSHLLGIAAPAASEGHLIPLDASPR